MLIWRYAIKNINTIQIPYDAQLYSLIIVNFFHLVDQLVASLLTSWLAIDWPVGPLVGRGPVG